MTSLLEPERAGRKCVSWTADGPLGEDGLRFQQDGTNAATMTSDAYGKASDSASNTDTIGSM